ncbi:TIGR03086 family metal-binding protein [Actinocrispum wychmicini]|uniref:Uncharacterized protein (TIGR03086 family) n=1 Tax=Actinocrispum wychmicini TaxID=1213861 RepID=A0A4R2JLG5_9PSEU|nr:TIGR03086 family metal-binding protein [Actinocrispum wychmicini]TCO60881.1 uncharacterized protein (TIGR03086 family) [Actinocrispum wychmicini]
MSNATDRFRRTAEGFLARIEAVPPDKWNTRTPCPQWTAREVVLHVINEQRRNLATVRGVEPRPLHGVGVAEMGQLPEADADADLAAAWREIGEGLTAAIADPACAEVPIPSPMGPVPFGTMADAMPEDVLIHTWDLARATGGDEKLDEDVVHHVYEHFKPMDEVLRQPWAFGPKVTPPADADLQTEFLCFVGRNP